jgi:hypothetical protein
LHSPKQAEELALLEQREIYRKKQIVELRTKFQLAQIKDAGTLVGSAGKWDFKDPMMMSNVTACITVP